MAQSESGTPRKRGQGSTVSTVQACPECDSRRINPRGDGLSTAPVIRDPERKWRCDDCQHCFDEPHERASRQGCHDGSLAARLAAADPDTDWSEIDVPDGDVAPGGDG